jgi:hypothetical protein
MPQSEADGPLIGQVKEHPRLLGYNAGGPKTALPQERQ